MGKNARYGEMMSRNGYKIAGSVFTAALFVLTVYLINNHFFTYSVILSVMEGTALISILAIAESMAIAVGGIDFSIAGICLLSATTMFYLVETGTCGVFIAVFCGLAISLAMGVINALLVVKAKVQPVVATFGTSLLVRGIAGAATGNITIFDTRPEFDFIKQTFFYIPVSLLVATLIMVGCYIVFRSTAAGRLVFAVGGSEWTARRSGLDVDKIKFYTYAAAGFIAGTGGLAVLADSTMSARFFGGSAELELLFATVIGGASYYSGAKIFFQVCIGAAVLAVLNRLIYGIFVFNYMLAVIIGLLFVIVVALRGNVFNKGHAWPDDKYH